VTALPLASRVLADSYGRVATDLRVSLTDRCNLRCAYCMPPEGLDWLPKDEVLRDEEIVRLIAIGVEQLGIREVRFTGGEPLLRPGLVGIVAATAALRPRPAISLTTNAIGLARRAADLAAAGLDRVNVSLDTLDPARFSGSPCRTDLPTCSPDWLCRSASLTRSRWCRLAARCER
jgi:cyclic pyranopterin phosphate synthase